MSSGYQEPSYKYYIYIFGVFFGKELGTGKRRFFVLGREKGDWINIWWRFSIG